MSASRDEGALKQYARDHLPDAHPWLRSLLLAGGAYVVLFTVVHAVLALGSDGATVADLVCLALVAAPQAVVATRRGADLTPWTAVLIGAVLILATALGLWAMRTGALDGTYSAWFLGAVTIDLLGIGVLGRLRVAWAAMAVIVALCTAWASSRGLGPAVGVGLVVRHVATLTVGTLLVISLRRSRRTFVAFQALRRRRSAEEEASRARAAARRVAVEQVLDQAGPTLAAIAEGRRFSDDDRRQVLVLEGALRDQIRNPQLMQGVLRESVAAARRRGVNVLLMDEAEGVDRLTRGRATAWLAEQLDATEGGGFIGRLRDLGDLIRVSAVNDDHGVSRSFSAELDGSG